MASGGHILEQHAGQLGPGRLPGRLYRPAFFRDLALVEIDRTAEGVAQRPRFPILGVQLDGDVDRLSGLAHSALHLQHPGHRHVAQGRLGQIALRRICARELVVRLIQSGSQPGGALPGFQGPVQHSLFLVDAAHLEQELAGSIVFAQLLFYIGQASENHRVFG